jgi:sensor histidine kinase YesM
MNRKTFFWVWLAWTVVGLSHALSRYSDIVKYKLEATFSYVETMGYVVTYSQWIIITLILIRFLRSFTYPFSYWAVGALFFIGLVCWLPFYFTAEYIASTFISESELANLGAYLVNMSSSVIFFYCVVYSLTFAACLGIVLADKTQQANQLNASLLQQKTEADLLLTEQRMQLMQSQLSPHVLFNCLSSISSLARDGERKALIEAVAMVGNLLRFTILNSPTNKIALYDEIGFVNDYIALQALRFEDRFICESKIDDIDEDIMCPPFTLQPLVENVFCHAVETTEEQVLIFLSIMQSNNKVHFNVRNTVPKKAKIASSTGTGLDNLRGRLRHLYADDFTLDIHADNTQFSVDLSIPLRPSRYDV